MKDSILLLKEKYSEDYRELTVVLSKSFFRSKDGSIRPASDLLLKNNKENHDEGKRATFSPDSAMLTEEYYQDSQFFIPISRNEMRADCDKMKQWALDATTPERQTAVLNYLANGDLNKKLGELLAPCIKGSYLDLININENSLIDVDQKHIIIGVLKQGSSRDFAINERQTAPDDTNEINELVSSFTPIANPKEKLEEIYNWWEQSNCEQIINYEKQIYPNGKFFEIKNELPADNADNADKINWLKFILLATLQKIGRTKPEANRNFVEQANQKEWLKHLLEDRSWGALSFFDKYLDESIGSIKYHQWIYRIFDLKIMSTNFDDTIDVILNLGQREFDINASLNDMFNTKESHHYQSGGSQIYPLKPFLGIGCHFLMRELTRKGIIDNNGIYQHCYLPVERVRKLFEAMGCTFSDKPSNNSRVIHQFLVEQLGEERATFNKCFDIPFLMIAKDDNCKKRFGFSN
jgi:hypothetical protein